MSAVLQRPATPDRLFLWVMHRFAEVFEDHAIIKGGLALRLMDSPRATTDIDYVFVPYRSKREIRARIEVVLAELEDAEISIELHSKMLRAEIRIDETAIQVEIDIGLSCKATPVATAGFARSVGEPSRIVRVMSLDVALANKLAAWNERRLTRDLYDCYFLGARLLEKPDRATLDARLAKVVSRLPKLKATKRMTRAELAVALRDVIPTITQGSLQAELGPILPPEELAGLVPRMRAALGKIAEDLE